MDVHGEGGHSAGESCTVERDRLSGKCRAKNGSTQTEVEGKDRRRTNEAGRWKAEENKNVDSENDHLKEPKQTWVLCGAVQN